MKQPPTLFRPLPRLCALALALLLASGCGTATPSASPATAVLAPTAIAATEQPQSTQPLPTAPPAAALPTQVPAPTPVAARLTYAFPDDAANAAAATAQIAAYISAHPGVQISAKPLPAADYTKQLAASLGDTGPDLFVSTDAQAPTLINGGGVLDLKTLLESKPDFQVGQLQPAALAIWQRGPALYGLPTAITPKVLFYNQDAFAAAGVPTPTPGWTWDDWLARAKQLTTRSGGAVTRYGTTLVEWSAMIWGNGGELLSADGTHTLLSSPEAAEGVQFAADMVNVHKVAPPPKDAGGPDPLDLFIAQKAAMMPGASNLALRLQAANLPFKWAIAALPSGHVAATPVSISGLGISARSPNQQAALDFATWVVGPAGAAVSGTLLPFTAPALQSATPRLGQVSGEEAILQALQHARTLPQIESWPKIKGLVDDALRPVWLGQQRVAAAYRKVEPDINALLKAG